jgi:membrane protease YdiL (CAAX protease family)
MRDDYAWGKGVERMTQPTISLPDDIISQPVEAELVKPNLLTVPRIIVSSIRGFFVERTGQIIGSAFILLMLWGTHGNLELLRGIIPGWSGPGINVNTRLQLIPGIPWDRELISWVVGALLLIGIPILLIKFVYKEPLSNYGLALPEKGRRSLAFLTFVSLTLVCLPAFAFASRDADMRATYPFFRPFSSTGQFIVYELCYFVFFLTIEFVFRGYLLFGLSKIRDTNADKGGEGVPGVFYFDRYALLIQMLSYTAWHLGKPLPELWGTLLWGLAAGALALTVKSIWPVVMSHWLLNVIFDAIVARPF